MSNSSGSRNKAFWPVMGFVMALSFGVLAYALKGVAYEFLRDNRIVNFSITGTPRATWEWIIAGVVFVILLMLSSLIVAASRPRQKSEVREKDVEKARQQMRRDIKAKKELQRRINRQMKG
jgi:type VI protein secretion system component VasK